MSKNILKIYIAAMAFVGSLEAAKAQVSIQCVVATAHSSAVLRSEGYSEFGEAHALSFVIVENEKNQLIITAIQNAQEMKNIVKEMTTVGAMKKDRIPQVVKSAMPESTLKSYVSQLMESAAIEALEGVLTVQALKRGDGDMLSFRMMDNYEHTGLVNGESKFLLRTETALSKGGQTTVTVPYFSQAGSWKKTDVEMKCSE